MNNYSIEEISIEEIDFLERVAVTYETQNNKQDELMRTLIMRTFRPFVHGGHALEFGCDNGYMTSLIAENVDKLTVVDGSKTFIEMAKKRNERFDNIEFVYSLFEDYPPTMHIKFDYIFGTYVLEHVKDAVDFLKLARCLLTDYGFLFLVVPNARALSRQLARHMGLLDDLYALTPNDINHGHRRCYDRILLDRDIQNAGLRQVSQGGIFLKLLADFQMDGLIKSGILGGPQLEGLYKMGLEYPDLAGSLFSVCRKD